jgi:hypothetical protein
MPDYNKGCIYKIKHQLDYNDENIYIGSTCNFIRRRCMHKSVCYNPNDRKYNYKLYQYIRENGGWDNFVMLEIEKFPCKDKPELCAEERRVIDELKSKLNCNVPGRTGKEYREDNKEKLAEYDKMKYENNKEKIAEHQKEYRENNKEKIAEHQKEYYESNKEKKLEKIQCDKCGFEVSKCNLTKHKKTQKCINFKPE